MISEQHFDLSRQMRFALLSGDRNPIHVDPVAVRRTLPAALVVHGVHVLLWALGLIADMLGDQRPTIERIRVRFLRFTYVGDRIGITVTARQADRIRATVTGGAVVRAEILITFGNATAAPAPIVPRETLSPGVGPLDQVAASIDGRCGQILFTPPAGSLAGEFPAAARWLGAERIDALAAATRLVGMVYPGLHSVLGGIDVRLMPEDGAGQLLFETGELRHGQIDATISGGGIVGTLDCRVPHAPVAQLSSEALRHLVTPGRYGGALVLVVGGSRGAGEASAKLLALGGAEVIVTYRDGEADAAAVIADIRRAGGIATSRRYDAAEPADGQLADLVPTHACWFATPVMTRPNAPLLNDGRLEEGCAVFAAGFFALAAALHARRADVGLFYPSTQWIEAPPPGLAEYVMAKAAGEVLALALPAALPGVQTLAPRLPAMSTDQTARMDIAAHCAANAIAPHLDRFIISG